MRPPQAYDLALLLRAAGGRLVPLLLPLLLALGLGFATAPGARHAGPDLAGGWERQADLTAVLRPTAIARAAVRPSVAKPETGFDGGDDRAQQLLPSTAGIMPAADRAAAFFRVLAAQASDDQRLRPEPRAPPA